jgi:glycosyltransferase involved in cell wall biosynthesis
MVTVRTRADEARQPVGTGAASLLCVSPLLPGMGIDTLLTAVGLLSHDRPALRLKIVGDGPLASALRGLAGAMGVEERVSFPGPLPPADVRKALRRCSMLVHPSSIEHPAGPHGFSGLLVEAMTCGTPVVTTDVGLPNMVRSDTTGVLVAPHHPAGLATAIAALLDDPVRAASIGAAGHRLISRRHERSNLVRSRS